MIINVGILQAGETNSAMRGDFVDYDDMFRQSFRDFNFNMTAYRVFEDEFPTNPDAEQAYIISGSRFGVYEDYPWIDRLGGFIRDCYSQSIPMVGICFGHQMLAKALGGTVEKFSGGWAIGMQSYTLNGDTTPFDQLAFHQDQVIEPPKEAELFCTSDFCKYAGLYYGDKAISVQAHPEFQNDYVRALTHLRSESFSDEQREESLTSLEQRTASPVLIQQLGQFIVDHV